MTDISKHLPRRRQAPVKAPPKMADTPKLVAPMDNRTRSARRWRDLYHQFRDATPLDTLSATVDALLRSLASVTVSLEQRACTDAPADDLAALLNSQIKLMDRLGLSPKTEPQQPDDPLTLHRRRMGWDQ